MGTKRESDFSKRQASLLPALKLLTTHLTQELCKAVFQKVRLAERDRKWSLTALVMFWTEVVIRAPQSLTQALQEVAAGMGRLTPSVEATTEAFFEKCKAMRPDFFLGVLEGFIRSILPVSRCTFSADTSSLLKRFGAVVILDGSRLEAIRHRLKILWDQRAVILPGCITALYDLHRGILRRLEFCRDAAAGEIRRAEQLLENAMAAGALVAGSLIVADRYYCTAQFFQFLGRMNLFGVFRRKRSLHLRKQRRLRKSRRNGVRIEEWLVVTGLSPKTPIVTLRWIRIRLPRRQVFEILTNVLDPQRLSAEEALTLYRDRWSIERMLYDLKVVLNLNRIYAANTNAVAMQVYASAIVYCALRVAQSQVAQDAQLAPDQISSHKFFCRFTAVAGYYWMAERYFIRVCERNRRVRIFKPTWTGEAFASVNVADILCESRTSVRRKRRFCKARRRWKSLSRFQTS